MRKLKDLIEKCDADIRAGHSREARRLLTSVKLARVPREWRLPLANLCRRAGLYTHGLILLKRLVLPSKTKHETAPTPQEIAEYGVLLLRSGAVSEALTMLQSVDTECAPEALLYRAFALFTRWEFRQAIPILDRYLKSPLEPYASLIARTNLAYAYAYCAWEEEYFQPALNLARENILMAKAGGYTHLERSCRAIAGQIYIQRNELDLAAREISAAHSPVVATNSNDHFLVNKWGLILEGLQTQSLAPFEKIRTAVGQNRDWEAGREADFYSLKVKFNKERFLYLYFGSPYIEFRRWCINQFETQQNRTVYVLGAKTSPRFDLNTGEIDGRSRDISGGKCHQLIEVLLRDFYQPLSISALFCGIFPDEHFDVASSPGRIHQILRRTRRWIEALEIPVRILEKDGFYSLGILGDFSFRIPLERSEVSSTGAYFQRLKTMFSVDTSFSTHEACQKLDLPTATMYRLMAGWVESGLLRHQGESGRKALYSFNSESSLSKKSA